MAQLIDGRLEPATPLEAELLNLARKAWESPAHLTTTDLDPLRTLVGSGAIDYALVVAGFHFINRIADLLHVDSEALPPLLRKVEPLRRLAVKISGRLFARMDLANRPFEASFDDVLTELRPLVKTMLGRPLSSELDSLAPRPQAAGYLHIRLEERLEAPGLPTGVHEMVERVVEEALPEVAEESTGFHARPNDPVEAFAFVGTRYAQRTTPAMIEALRHAGYDDLALLNLAIAVAEANAWARLHRLLGLEPRMMRAF